ncbi:Hsp33 family molecular chaperone HslO [Lactobacillus sp. Sy-1]|uniref:Hsp33 family molecular chaperone HslO n=1 Tax=Lactobacillus sp. Sy-1 TaxID=2109645 RepID=UPI001C5A5859|nr:Hsp33 family molecular chaperone HslO [Lactobacillus sp. Sy-1]MBW1604772.1 Hsp33 family molecular chaperone HslO [Lactobacillus sp. Sy-1]
MQKDHLVKSITKDGMFRAYAIDATGVVAEAQKRQDTWSASSAALGRTLVGSLLLSASVLKGKETMTVQINGGGPVGTIMVDADAKGHVKGYVQNPHVHLPLNKVHKIDVGKAVGINGFMQVMKSMGGDEPYSSSVPLASGEIGDDFTYYLAQSEQIPSAVGVSVFVNDDNSIKVAGGYLIQTLPDADDKAIDRLEKRLKEIPMVSELLLSEQTPLDILNLIFGEDNLDILTDTPVEFTCSCSKKQFAKSLSRVNPAEIKKIIDEDHGAELVCHFCGARYNYDEEELKSILAVSEKRAELDAENGDSNQEPKE